MTRLYGAIGGPIECREVDAGVEVRGVALAYGDVAQLGGGVREVWEPGAARVAEDAVLGLGHPAAAQPLARRGQGLTVEDDGRELALRAVVPAAIAARMALAESIEAGLYRGISVEFMPSDAPMIGNTRKVRQAVVPAFALVGSPAFPGSVLRDQDGAIGNPLRRWVDFA